MQYSFVVQSKAAIAVAVFSASALAQPLSLDEALRTGETRSPQLAAQRHSLDAAAQQVGRAGELPDPKARIGIENLPVSGPARFSDQRDFMTSRAIGFTQEFPNSAKREARNLRAERLRNVEGASLSAQRVTVRRDTALAWFDVHYAEAARASIERLARQFTVQLDALPSAIARGRQTAADSFALRQAFEQVNDRVIEQERMVARARIMLARWVGDEANRPLAELPDMQPHARDQLVSRLAEHPELRVFERREDVARAEVDLAKSAKKPDWMLEVGYNQRTPEFDNMLTVMLSFELPWQVERRQDRDIASRLAEVEQVRATREEARRILEAELRGWLADYDSAQRRIDRFERVLLPLARDRREAALAAYQGARGELGGVLEAERTVTETELALVQALAERAKAWASLNYLYPRGSTQ